MLSTRILSICAVLIVLSYEVLADSYTCKKDDDLVRLLKSGCGSTRLLLQAIKDNGLKTPYKLSKGQVVKLPCSLPKKMITYTNKYVKWDLGNVPIKYVPVTSADACKAACLADPSCPMADWEEDCYFYSRASPVSELQNWPDNYVYIKEQIDL